MRGLILDMSLLALCGVLWWTLYAQPKSRVMEATTACMTRQATPDQAALEVCLKKSQKDHGSDLLEMLGY